VDRSPPYGPGSVWVNGTLLDKIITIKKMEGVDKKRFEEKLRKGD
jgi:hypothetical protein